MKEIGIYCIENLLDHKKYIGQSVNLKKRLSKHLYELKNNRHFNDHLQQAWNKYGEENFKIFILDYCEKDELDKKEIYYIDLYNTMNRDYGYNKDSGGNKCKTRNEESCDKMRTYWKEHGGANKGLLQATEQAKKPVVQYTKNGEIISEFDSIMEASKQTGINFRNISSACTGTHKTSFGFVWRFKGDDFDKFKVKDDIKTRKVVRQYDLDEKFIKEYPSLSDVSKQTDFNFKNVSQVCNGKRKSAYGYIWKFVY